MNTDPTRTNMLAGETSPYLIQHANNPVAWRPWSADTLAEARAAHKPILLSIGYSACHWCHVMAHESFEDAETAELMNRGFVNIKVDREERPDLDKVYQLAHQLLTRRPGGWPLTIFLTPHDLAPFFAGTYFPTSSRYDMPCFRDVLTGVLRMHERFGNEIREQNAAVISALAETEIQRQNTDATVSREHLRIAWDGLLLSFDSTHGGFGHAPKFPHTGNMELLLCKPVGGTDARALDPAPRHAALFTLKRMVLGGLFDQVGGGFYRYSTDEYWMIPHFEKMLYDNGPLLGLCSTAAQITGDPLFASAAHKTAAWMMREMQAQDGGYYSSLDADSEGQEGKFYVWTRRELEQILSESEFRICAEAFALKGPPKFEGRFWHLHADTDAAFLARRLKQDTEAVRSRIDGALAKLFVARESRVRPHCDDKILTSWNGLAIGGMATAARIFAQPQYYTSARKAADFVHDHLWQRGRLCATTRAGRAHVNGFLDDYAFLMDGLLCMLRARWCSRDLEFAIDLADAVLTHFEDKPKGGFYFTSDDHEKLLLRSKPYVDESTPAGNGVAALAFTRLGHLLGNSRYLDAAARIFDAAAGSVERAPHAHASLLRAWMEFTGGAWTIIVRGETPSLGEWQNRCDQAFAPMGSTYAIPHGAKGLPRALDRFPADRETTAYLCSGLHCLAPIRSVLELEAVLAEYPAQG